MTNDKSQLTILIQGRVQGVFFRRGVKTEAARLGLSGEVKNLDDGTVQVVAEGNRDKLQALLDWCYHGTKLAMVESLKFFWATPGGKFRNFEIIRRGNYLEDKLLALKNLSSQVLRQEFAPNHVAIIPDGNRRWAKTHKFQVFKGHEQGVKNTMNLLEEALRLKIPYLTFWGFSTENWKRDKLEVNYLMKIFREQITLLKKKLHEYQVQFRHFGRKDRLPKDIMSQLSALEAGTENFSKAHLGLAIDYGGRDELLRAVNKMRRSEEEVSEENFGNFLDTKGFPDPDLIIRTSGEQRLSGLMPWQGTYAELYFTPVLFPDFGILEFRKAISEFGERKRNFGS